MSAAVNNREDAHDHRGEPTVTFGIAMRTSTVMYMSVHCANPRHACMLKTLISHVFQKKHGDILLVPLCVSRSVHTSTADNTQKHATQARHFSGATARPTFFSSFQDTYVVPARIVVTQVVGTLAFCRTQQFYLYDPLSVGRSRQQYQRLTAPQYWAPQARTLWCDCPSFQSLSRHSPRHFSLCTPSLSSVHLLHNLAQLPHIGQFLCKTGRILGVLECGRPGLHHKSCPLQRYDLP